MMGKRTKSRAFLTQIAAGSFLLIVLVALVIGELWSSRGSDRPQLEELAQYGSVPAFSLTERSGKRISTDDLRDKIWIADFIYTRCTDTCPLQSAMMASLQTEFEKYPDLELVSVTVDPLNDSPEVLSRYAARYGAKKNRWLFLTGELDDISRLVQGGFHLSAVPVKGETNDTVVLHSSRFILIDQHGTIRGYYDSSDEHALERLRENAKRLLDGKT